MAHNPRLLGGLAVLVSAGLVAGATVAYVNAGDESPSKAVEVPVTPGVAPTSAPLPSEAPSETPSASPTAVAPTATPSATPSATASPSPSKSSGGTTAYAYPRPTRTYDGLRLSATMNPGDGYTTTRFSMSVTASDGDGTIYLQSIDWGDGTKTAEADPTACKTYPSPTSQPGPYEPQADSYQKAFPHTYAKAGDYVVVVTVASVNKDCRPHGPSREDRVARFDGANSVTVTAPPAATPSPTPSAAP